VKKREQWQSCAKLARVEAKDKSTCSVLWAPLDVMERKVVCGTQSRSSLILFSRDFAQIKFVRILFKIHKNTCTNTTTTGGKYNKYTYCSVQSCLSLSFSWALPSPASFPHQNQKLQRLKKAGKKFAASSSPSSSLSFLFLQSILGLLPRRRRMPPNHVLIIPASCPSH
jgi:hypothetical protein